MTMLTLLTSVAALVATASLAAITLLHGAWVLGSTLWLDRVIPRTPESAGGRALFAPSRGLTGIVTVTFALLALLPGLTLGWLPLPPPHMAPTLCLGAAFIFVVRAIGDFRYCGLFRRIRSTTFARWDARLYTPLCLLLAACYGLLGVAPH
ncbi:DUF3995 domain-containing protein [Nitratidesulfovibrio liaohensis]|uniref:DUF3995 domain-containing protein n=1 Tax=Nitratidesulfovibrio liaohensis TaxID=2604158 RepID=A0ABY9R331_9BACT|nr:DUF3995 domain-containing protein [Nitratidesulfovibrio liaohensis]WMW65233.1 DUF3995 domain-containing protein [Nitratidesulfovibrio liaohensis]